ncbi:hypothetical protein K7X08_034563 [Anisodus acutangulus]|uniref:Glycosylphosphatidylinositol anchor biosynthesis protein 11 n=1 Tax=Anisodus acutangulus TaxID=402998 RepID=A0A9Q1R332_9SOLA|nr:hypothetical protein K7X08_034563 [Anisodus acutangulus]
MNEEQNRTLAELRNKMDKKKNAILVYVSPLKALTLHLICGVALGLALWVPSISSQTLRLISVFLPPVLILLYSHLRHDRSQCSYLRAVGRGLLALPAGYKCSGATILGAPVGFEYFPKTLSWSLLMSLLTFVPAACVFGSSWTDWHRSTDCMICLPAHGAVIGAWFGAWPMPLDWESPWQEWPICVTYGAVAGYLVGLVASLGCIFFRNRQQHLKEE